MSSRSSPSGFDPALVAAMLREEWRMHARLFGGWRFAAFPAIVGLITATGVAALAWVGVEIALAIAGLHLLVFIFGLQTGSLGLVAQDAIEQVLGEISLLVSTPSHLPLSRRRAVAAFLVEDLLYYTGLVLLPIALAFLPAGLLFEPALLSAAPRLAVSLPATFALGLVTTTAGIALSRRGIPGGIVLLGAVGAIVWSAWTGASVATLTPYGLYAGPAGAAALVSGLAIVVLAAIGFTGLGRHEPRPARTRSAALSPLADRIGDDNGLVARSLLELARSSGGVGKIAFSATVLLGVAWGVVALVGTLGGVDPQAGLTFGPLLALSAFTSYNWLTTASDAGTYRRFPLTIEDVVAAKLSALYIVGLPVSLFALGIALFGLGTTPADAAVGALLLVGVYVYVGGVTAFLAGLQPNEFLFDTLLFSAFGLAVMIPVAPMLIVGLVLPSPGMVLLGGLAGSAVLLGILGIVLGRRAGPRWEARYRSGEID